MNKILVLMFCAAVAAERLSAQVVHEPGWGIEVFATVTAPSVGIDFDSDGNVYVANCGSHFVVIPVWKINPLGTPTPFGDAINCGDSLAFDGAGLLHAGSGQGQIFRIQADGTTTLFVSGGGLNNVNGLAFNSAGNLYAVNSSTGTVSQITPSGAITTFASGLGAACGLTISSDGFLFTANANSTAIYRIFPLGAIETYVTLPVSGCCGLGFDHEGNLFATSGPTGNLYKITPSRVVSLFASGFDNPLGVAMDPAGDLYVSSNDDNLVHRIFQFEPTVTPTPAPIPALAAPGIIMLALLLTGLLALATRFGSR